MGDVRMQLDKATMPATVVLGILMIFGGYWVNAQDNKIDELEDKVEAVEKELGEQDSEVNDSIADIKTTQAVQATVLENIAATLERLESKIDEE